MGWVKCVLGSNDSQINPHMRANYGCSQTVVSKKGRIQTDRHTYRGTLQLYIVPLIHLSEYSCGAILCQVMVKQEIYRKLGYAIQADEEQVRVQLEALQAELNAPTQFKVRLQYICTNSSDDLHNNCPHL